MKSWNYLCTQTNRLVNFNFHITFICLTIITLEFSFSNVKILMRIGTQILNFFYFFRSIIFFVSLHLVKLYLEELYKNV